jgi:hypothetical protein
MNARTTKVDLKASDLRIGNYYLNEFGKTVLADKTNLAYMIGMLDRDALKPILLTPDWWEKFGFEWSQRRSWYSNGDWEFTRWEDHTYHIMEYASVSVTLKYVHDLQNLYYALTKQELQIKEIA